MTVVLLSAPNGQGLISQYQGLKREQMSSKGNHGAPRTLCCFPTKAKLHPLLTWRVFAHALPGSPFPINRSFRSQLSSITSIGSAPSPVSRALRHYLVDPVPFGSRYLIISLCGCGDRLIQVTRLVGGPTATDGRDSISSVVRWPQRTPGPLPPRVRAWAPGLAAPHAAAPEALPCAWSLLPCPTLPLPRGPTHRLGLGGVNYDLRSASPS